MRFRRLVALVLLAVGLSILNAAAPLFAAESAGLAPGELRCESMVDPLGIEPTAPHLSWVLRAANDADRGQRQTAYQVLVASTEALLQQDRGDLWDSGRVASDATIHVAYAGRPMIGRMRCHWKVRVWDREGRVSAWSAPARWETGLQASDWKAAWIDDGRKQPSRDEDFFRDDPAPQFRKEFIARQPVRQARLYISGLGYYEAKLNGAKVGDCVLDPGWTTYTARVLYSTYDVTSQVTAGRNCLGFTLGNGWYNPLPLKMWGRLNLREQLPIGRPRAIAQLELEYADGSREIVASDATWKVAPGPLLRNNTYLGEVYDARRETPDWDRVGFDDASWSQARAASSPIGPLQAQMQPPIRVTARLKPVARTEPRPGVFIFDLGQNYAGWVRLQVRGAAGTTVRMRFGELLRPDGNLNVMTAVCGQIKRGTENRDGEHPALAYQGNVYILSGRGDEAYVPRFTWQGFRYVEITGYPGTPPLDAIEGQRLSADVAPAGEFTCSNEAFNRIQEITRWTFLSNLFSVQSDCPARERFGYGGDIVPTYEAFVFNFDMANLYAKVIRDFADALRPNGGATETAPSVGVCDGGLGGGSGPIGWQVAYPTLLDGLYRYYGDLRPIREQYPAVKRQLEFMRSAAKNHRIETCIGDHESLDPKSLALTSTAFYYHQAERTARFAELLGHEQDAREYRELAASIRSAFQAAFFREEDGRCGLGTPACQAFALRFGLIPAEGRAKALDTLLRAVEQRGRHMTSGIFGARYVLESLSREGRADAAYRIVDRKGFPGWRHMLDGGASTLWEHWEFSDNVYSHNHPMFGSVSTWFFEDLGGIRADAGAVGFDRFVVQPQIVGDLNHASASYRSVRGPIRSAWRVEGGRVTLEVDVPPNTKALVYVPTDDANSVTESGVPASKAAGLTARPAQRGSAVFEAVGGRYRFTAEAPKRRSE